MNIDNIHILYQIFLSVLMISIQTMRQVPVIYNTWHNPNMDTHKYASGTFGAQLMEGGAHPSPFAALAASLIRTRYPFTAGLTERVFPSPHGEAQPRTHNLTANFCTVIEPL